MNTRRTLSRALLPIAFTIVSTASLAAQGAEGATATFAARTAAFASSPAPVVAPEDGRLAVLFGEAGSRAAGQDELSKPRLYYSAPLAALLGTAGGVLGYGLGFVLLDCSDESSRCENGPENGEYLLMGVGLAVGASTGAHIGGRRSDSEGNLPLTLALAAAGSFPAFFTDVHGENDDALLGVVGSVGGAVLGDYLFRRRRR